MSTAAITVTEAARHFSDYVSRVAYRHESFVLHRGNKPVAELRPMPSGRRLGDLPDILRSLPHLAHGDAAAFAADVDSARASMPSGNPEDPWAF